MLTVDQILSQTGNTSEKGIAYLIANVMRSTPLSRKSLAPPGLAMVTWLFDYLKGAQLLGVPEQDGLRIQLLQEFRDELIGFEQNLEKILGAAPNKEEAVELPAYDLAFLDHRFAMITGRSTALNLATAQVVPDPQDSVAIHLTMLIHLTTIYYTRFEAACRKYGLVEPEATA